jgi:hypothetical protein
MYSDLVRMWAVLQVFLTSMLPMSFRDEARWTIFIYGWLLSSWPKGRMTEADVLSGPITDPSHFDHEDGDIRCLRRFGKTAHIHMMQRPNRINSIMYLWFPLGGLWGSPSCRIGRLEVWSPMFLRFVTNAGHYLPDHTASHPCAVPLTLYSDTSLNPFYWRWRQHFRWNFGNCMPHHSVTHRTKSLDDIWPYLLQFPFLKMETSGSSENLIIIYKAIRRSVQ